MDRLAALLALTVGLAGCASAQTPAASAATSPEVGAADARSESERRTFERDRQAILSMAGDYDVTYRFRETVPFRKGYQPKEPFRTGAHEVVRVIEDSGEFISLQHLLVVGKGEEKRTVKHWRQDWIYEPDHVLVYIGGNAWKRRELSESEVEGKWAQVVYQVAGSPRYGAVAKWTHDNGVSQWEPPREWRPVPRRDATKRDDYHAIAGVNRHAITPFGWVMEQDNSKMVLTGGEPRVLVREVGLHTYRTSDTIQAEVAEDYWSATKKYWAGVRAEWERIIAENRTFGLTIQGEPAPLYRKLLGLADQVKNGKTATTEAVREARSIIDEYVTTDVGALAERLRGDAG